MFKYLTSGSLEKRVKDGTEEVIFKDGRAVAAVHRRPKSKAGSSSSRDTGASPPGDSQGVSIERNRRHQDTSSLHGSEATPPHKRDPTQNNRHLKSSERSASDRQSVPTRTPKDPGRKTRLTKGTLACTEGGVQPSDSIPIRSTVISQGSQGSRGNTTTGPKSSKTAKSKFVGTGVPPSVPEAPEPFKETRSGGPSTSASKVPGAGISVLDVASQAPEKYTETHSREDHPRGDGSVGDDGHFGPAPLDPSTLPPDDQTSPEDTSFPKGKGWANLDKKAREKEIDEFLKQRSVERMRKRAESKFAAETAGTETAGTKTAGTKTAGTKTT